jgi:hypothetical protein
MILFAVVANDDDDDDVDEKSGKCYVNGKIRDATKKHTQLLSFSYTYNTGGFKKIYIHPPNADPVSSR